MAPNFMALAKGVFLGTYEILASLRAGGMGEVYRARDSKLGREVTDQKFCRRIFRKIRIGSFSSNAKRISWRLSIIRISELFYITTIVNWTAALRKK
jgi:serine/threonine protein kinase